MKISIDSGHRYNKGYNGDTFNVFPAIVGEAHAGFIEEQSQEQEITIDGHRWFVGDSAIVQSQFQQSGNNAEWAFGEGYKALLLYGIAHFIPEDAGTRSVNLVTGLPIADLGNREKLTELYQRSFTVSQPHRPGSLKININSIEWQPQGFAPIRPYLKTDRGMNEITIVIDLGSRNIGHIMVKGKRIVKNGKSDSVENMGATPTINAIIKKVADDTGRTYSFYEVQDVINTGRADYKGVKFDVADIITNHRQEYGNQILSYLSGLFGDDLNKANDIIIVGGGDYLIGDFIQTRYPYQVRRSESPQLATVKAQWS